MRGTLTTMSLEACEHVVLTHIEVVGDIEAFASAWRAWVDRCVRDADGLVDATLHRERTGRRLLMIQRWHTAAAFEAWHASEAAQSVHSLFETHAVRSATSQWQPEDGA